MPTPFLSPLHPESIWGLRRRRGGCSRWAKYEAVELDSSSSILTSGRIFLSLSH